MSTPTASDGTVPTACPEGRARQLRRQHARVLRLLHLRRRGRPRLPDGLLPGLRPGDRRRCCPSRRSASPTSPGRSGPSSSGTSATSVGRKKMLVLTLLLMGVSTFLIGALPSYAAIGVAAPILLVVLRVLQGLSAAGEQSGANSLTMEHAPEGRRGFFTSFTLSGTQAGLILRHPGLHPGRGAAGGPAVQLGLAGAVLPVRLVVAVGYWVRRTLPETPEFEKVEETDGRGQAARRRPVPRPLGERAARRPLRARLRGEHHRRPRGPSPTPPTTSAWSGRRSCG